MTLNKDKCAFGVTEVKFLGNVLSKKGIKVDPENEKAIGEMPTQGPKGPPEILSYS